MSTVRMTTSRKPSTAAALAARSAQPTESVQGQQPAADPSKKLERAMGIEPTTFSLGS
jgi:hypothetical protein